MILNAFRKSGEFYNRGEYFFDDRTAMRILNISAQKPDSTGSGTYLAETVAAQAAAGHTTAVICGVDNADGWGLPDDTIVYPVRFQTEVLPFDVVGMSDEMPYPSTRYRDMTPEMVAQFKAAFAEVIKQADAEFHPDVVICHHLYLVTSIARDVLPERCVVGLSHATDLRQMASHDLEHDYIVEQIAALDGIYALHDAQRPDIAQTYCVDADRVEVVGTGYNQKLFNTDGLSAGSNHEAPLRLLYVGKIWRAKGVMELIEAYGALADTYSPDEITLELVGAVDSTEEWEHAQQLAKACPLPVEFLGKKTPAELAEFYRTADIFVLPSYYEGLPLVVVEALACGCAVVVTDLPGLRPWIETQVPDASVLYLEPPRMLSLDVPVPEDVPGFRKAITEALREACAACLRGEYTRECDTHRVTWEGVTNTILNYTQVHAQERKAQM